MSGVNVALHDGFGVIRTFMIPGLRPDIITREPVPNVWLTNPMAPGPPEPVMLPVMETRWLRTGELTPDGAHIYKPDYLLETR